MEDRTYLQQIIYDVLFHVQKEHTQIAKLIKKIEKTLDKRKIDEDESLREGERADILSAGETYPKR